MADSKALINFRETFGLKPFFTYFEVDYYNTKEYYKGEDFDYSGPENMHKGSICFAKTREEIIANEGRNHCRYTRIEPVYQEQDITLGRKEKLEQILLNKYGSFAYSKHKFDGEISYTCQCQFFWEAYEHSASGPTKEDALLNLLCKLGDRIKSSVRKVFEVAK